MFSGGKLQLLMKYLNKFPRLNFMFYIRFLNALQINITHYFYNDVTQLVGKLGFDIKCISFMGFV